MPRHESVFCRGWNAAVFFLSSRGSAIFSSVFRAFDRFPRWNDYGRRGGEGRIQIRSTMRVFFFSFFFFFLSFFLFFPFFFLFCPPSLPSFLSPLRSRCTREGVVHQVRCFFPFFLFLLLMTRARKNAREASKSRALWQTFATKGFFARERRLILIDFEISASEKWLFLLLLPFFFFSRVGN